MVIATVVTVTACAGDGADSEIRVSTTDERLTAEQVQLLTERATDLCPGLVELTITRDPDAASVDVLRCQSPSGETRLRLECRSRSWELSRDGAAPRRVDSCPSGF